jgi:hypothetical protein
MQKGRQGLVSCKGRAVGGRLNPAETQFYGAGALNDWLIALRNRLLTSAEASRWGKAPLDLVT